MSYRVLFGGNSLDCYPRSLHSGAGIIWRLLRTFERVQAVGIIWLERRRCPNRNPCLLRFGGCKHFRSLMLQEGINVRTLSNAHLSRMFQIWTALGSRNFAIRSLLLSARYHEHLVLPHLYIFDRSDLLQSVIIQL